MTEKIFAYYKLPGQDVYTSVVPEHEPVSLGSLDELDGREGFVVAPFTADTEHPILLLNDCNASTQPLPAMTDGEPCDEKLEREGEAKVRLHYGIDFANYHTQLEKGFFRKIVLARTLDLKRIDTASAERLFFRACRLYMNMYVALFSTPQSGTWLIATPETLVEGRQNHWQTMALAGTMSVDEKQWSDKNREEQLFVTRYIVDCLQHFTRDIETDGPHSLRAVNVQHLQTLVRFTLQSDDHVGSLLQKLHPTPAVCGLPKEDTRRFILEQEAMPRAYYSGFSGPLHPRGETHLYVTLRCMQVLDDRYRLYAGGGLLPESREEEEWHETEAKMRTMLNVLGQ